MNPTQTIYLYPNGAPDTNGFTDADEYVKDGAKIFQIATPRMDIYRTDIKQPKGIILSIPGGRYAFVSSGNEGEKVAERFVPRGYIVAVLKYRLPNGHAQIPFHDALQAMRLLRDQAEKWGDKETPMCLMGFSAGGHLAASLLTRYPDTITRPDSCVLVYPVISMDSTLTHKESCRQLLGETPTNEERAYWSCEKQVHADMPPCLIVACQDDGSVKVMNSIRFYEALTANKVPASLVVVPVGGHGWGFERSFPDRALIDEAIYSFIDTKFLNLRKK